MNLRFINKLPIISFVVNFILRKIKDKRSAEVNSIPKHLLKKKHTLNGSILANRDHLLEVLPKEGVIAEIGVDSGNLLKK